MWKISEREGSFLQFNLLVICGLIEQGAVNGPRLKAFLEKHLDRPSNGELPDDELTLLLQLAIGAIDKWDSGTRN